MTAVTRFCCHLPPYFTLLRKFNSPRYHSYYYTPSNYSEKIKRFSIAGPSTDSVMASAAKKVWVLVANGTEPIEAVVQIDILRRAKVEVIVTSMEKELWDEALHGVKIPQDSATVVLNSRS